MPMHDWMKVEAGIFHHYHHSWIEEIQRTLNSGLLPADMYALAEQELGAFGPDVLTLQKPAENGSDSYAESFQGSSSAPAVLVEEPQARLVGETNLDFYRLRQKSVVVRHVTDDSIIAVIEVVSRGNKSAERAIHAFVEKAGIFWNEACTCS